MRKAVIFDMDGVLVDSQPFHFEVDRVTLRRSGFPAEKAHVVPYAGMATVDRFQKYRKDYALEKTADELVVLCEAVRDELLLSARFEPMPGVAALLRALRAKAVKTAVASSSAPSFIDAILNEIGLAHYFDVVLSGERMPRSKPAPDLFLAAAKALDTAPEDCIVIEDSTNGVTAAYRAGMRCVGYQNPNSGDQDLSLAWLRIQDFSDLTADAALGLCPKPRPLS